MLGGGPIIKEGPTLLRSSSLASPRYTLNPKPIETTAGMLPKNSQQTTQH